MTVTLLPTVPLGDNGVDSVGDLCCTGFVYGFIGADLAWDKEEIISRTSHIYFSLRVIPHSCKPGKSFGVDGNYEYEYDCE